MKYLICLLFCIFGNFILSQPTIPSNFLGQSVQNDPTFGLLQTGSRLRFESNTRLVVSATFVIDVIFNITDITGSTIDLVVGEPPFLGDQYLGIFQVLNGGTNGEIFQMRLSAPNGTRPSGGFTNLNNPPTNETSFDTLIYQDDFIFPSNFTFVGFKTEQNTVVSGLIESTDISTTSASFFRFTLEFATAQVHTRSIDSTVAIFFVSGAQFGEILIGNYSLIGNSLLLSISDPFDVNQNTVYDLTQVESAPSTDLIGGWTGIRNPGENFVSLNIIEFSNFFTGYQLIDGVFSFNLLSTGGANISFIGLSSISLGIFRIEEDTLYISFNTPDNQTQPLLPPSGSLSAPSNCANTCTTYQLTRQDQFIDASLQGNWGGTVTNTPLRIGPVETEGTFQSLDISALSWLLNGDVLLATLNSRDQLFSLVSLSGRFQNLITLVKYELDTDREVPVLTLTSGLPGQMSPPDDNCGDDLCAVWTLALNCDNIDCAPNNGNLLIFSVLILFFNLLLTLF